MAGHICNQNTLSTFQVIVCLNRVYFQVLGVFLSFFLKHLHLTLPLPVSSSLAKSLLIFWLLVQIPINHVGV